MKKNQEERFSLSSLTALALVMALLAQWHSAHAQGLSAGASSNVVVDWSALDAPSARSLAGANGGLLFPGAKAPRSRLQVAPLVPQALPPTYRTGASIRSGRGALRGAGDSLPSGYVPSPSIVDGVTPSHLPQPPASTASSSSARRRQAEPRPVAARSAKGTQKRQQELKEALSHEKGVPPGYTPSASIVDGPKSPASAEVKAAPSPVPTPATPTPPLASPSVPTPPTAPEPTAPPTPAAPAPAATRPTGEESALIFAAGESSLPANGEAVLKSVADRLAANSALSARVQAYAAGGDGTASRARRLSLSRALAVRSYLLDHGIDSTRIEVRALGTPTDGNPDRVEIGLLRP